MRTLLLSILFLFMIVMQVLAQNPRLDRLRDSVENFDGDSTHTSHLVNLSEALVDFDLIEGKQLALKALKIAESKHNDHDIAIALLNLSKYLNISNQFDSSRWYIDQAKQYFEEYSNAKYLNKVTLYEGLVYQSEGSHDSAIASFDQVINYYTKQKDSLNAGITMISKARSSIHKRDNLETQKLLLRSWKILKTSNASESQIFALNLMGEVHLRLGQAPESLEHFQEGLNLAIKYNNLKGQLKNKNGLGTFSFINGEIDKSKSYFLEAIELAKALGDQYEYTGILHNYAYVNIMTGDLDTATEYYRLAIENNERNNLSCLLPYSNEGLAMVFEKQGKLDESLAYFKKALQLANDCQMTQNEITILQGTARVQIAKNDISKAIKTLNKAQQIAERLNFKKPIKEIALELSKIYKTKKDYKTALHYFEIYNTLQDSLFNEESVKKITQLTEQYQFDLEKEELKTAQEKQQLQFSEDLKRQEENKKAMALGLVTTLVLLIALGQLYYTKLETNKNLLKLNEEKNELLSIVSHDLRNPLNQIKGALPIIRHNLHQLNQEQHELLELISNNTDRLRDMISRVLDVSAIESNIINLRTETADLGEILEHVAKNFNIQASKKQIEIHYKIEKDKFFALVDKNYCIQILENIISNGIKYNPIKSNIYLSISIRKEIISLSIMDEGPGISIEDQKMLFTRYKKLSAKPTDGETSTGLGLSIAKKYVDAMNGEITFKSEVGKGSTFTIQFNAVQKS